MNYILLIIAIVVFLGLMALRQNSSQSGDSGSTNQPGTKLQSRKFAAATTDPDTNIVVMTKAEGDFTNVSNTATIDAVTTVMTGSLKVNGAVIKTSSDGKSTSICNPSGKSCLNLHDDYADMSITNSAGITNRWVVQPDGNVVQYNNKTSTWATSWGREVDAYAIRKDRDYRIRSHTRKQLIDISSDGSGPAYIEGNVNRNDNSLKWRLEDY